MQTKKGFTLIELLVVVLIIGILAAVAVPQYQKAVAKSRYAAMKPIVKSLADAAQTYYLANGTYFNYFDELDIDTNGTLSSNRQVINFPWGSCNQSNTETNKYVYCKHNNVDISYLIFLSGKRYCVAYGDRKSISWQICKEETGANSTNGWYLYP